MIVATATNDAEGTKTVLLGLTRENVTRLMAGQPIHVSATNHPGFPTELSIGIFFGEDERALTEQIRPLIDRSTKVVAVPREKGQVS